MIIGKYIRLLLDERKRVILPGFGNLEVIAPEGTQTPSGNRISPPGISVRFDTSFSKDDDLLAETLAAGEVLERDEAQQRVLELVDAIRFSLDKGEDYLLPETGNFSRDVDGKIHFHADPAWLLEPDQYGLESMDLLELEELPIEEEETKETVLESEERPTAKVTTLAPPRAKPRNKKWRVIWLVAAALIVVLAVLILIPSDETESSERKGLFNRKPDAEVIEQDAGMPDQSVTDTQEQVSESETEAPEQALEPETDVEESLPVEVTKNFFIVAGSFNKLKNASDLQDKLNSRGFQAEVMITENRMYRVSVASYASKEEAEKALRQIKSEPDLESCWLLSN